MALSGAEKTIQTTQGVLIVFVLDGSGSRWVIDFFWGEKGRKVDAHSEYAANMSCNYIFAYTYIYTYNYTYKYINV